MRRAEQIGLPADILCMSGAGVGHLTNALRDDPQIEDKGEIALVLGQNDARNSEGAGDSELVYTIDQGVEKVRKETERLSNKSLEIFMKVAEQTAPPYPRTWSVGKNTSNVRKGV